MNEKLLSMAKEAGFYLETPNGEEHYAIPMLDRFSARVLTSAVSDNSELLNAAKEVIERWWDSPLWKDLLHKGDAINRLRKAIEAAGK